jgi:competence protein ComEA
VEPSGAPWRVLETTESAAATPPGASPARQVPWLAVGAGVAALVVAAIAVALTVRSEPIADVSGAEPYAAMLAPGSIPPRGSDASGGEVVVDVSGAVAHPGLYRLSATSRVGDAIAAAGGYAGTVDAGRADRELNLAAMLHDGDKVRVPMRGEAPTAAAAGSSAAAGGTTGGPIDINRATAEALDTLPGVGPATVAKILAAREQQPFASVDDLGTRKVVGAATLEKLRPLVIVAP